MTKTQGFILQTQDYRDTSLLTSFYTREHGKIRGIIRGIRDARGRYGSTLEPFSLNEILFYKRKRGGDLHQVTQVDLLTSFTDVREDLERLSYASYFTELINELVEVEESNPAIFDLMKDTLVFLASGASAKRVARIFEIKFLGQLGLLPEIKQCVVCRKEPDDTAYFSAGLGGILCKSCSLAQRGEQGIPASKGTLNFLYRAHQSELKDLYTVKVSYEVGHSLEKILRRFVDYQLHKPLKSVAFIEKMRF